MDSTYIKTIGGARLKGKETTAVLYNKKPEGKRTYKNTADTAKAKTISRSHSISKITGN